MDLSVGFFRNASGARLAFGTAGRGPPLVCTPGWFSHAQLQWENAPCRRFFTRLAEGRTLVVYDRQGTGLSAREPAADFSLEKELSDLEALLAHLGFDRAALFGLSQGGALALAYAATHPEQISRVGVYGAYASGPRLGRPELRAPLLALVQAHWGLGSKALAALFIPSLLQDAEAVSWLDRYQREAMHPDTAVRILSSVWRWDVTDLLPRVRAPTLVVHRRGDRAIPLAGGIDLAEGVPGARLVLLEGDVHLPWLQRPEEVLDALAPFFAEELREPVTPTAAPREPALPLAPAPSEAWGRSGRQYRCLSRTAATSLSPAPVVRVAVAQTDGALLAEANPEGLYQVPPAHRDAQLDQALGWVDAAARRRAGILLLPELAVDLSQPGMQEALVERARRHRMLVVPGSFHDPGRKQNLARVLGPEGVLWEQPKHVPARIRLGGQTVVEGIQASEDRRVTVGDTPYGRLAVVICRDFLDLDLRVALKNADPPVDLVLNPAFTPVTEDFAAAHFEARRSLYAFTFFGNAAVFGGSQVCSPERRRRRRRLGPGVASLLVAEVDLMGLRAERERQSGALQRRFIQSTR